MKGEIDKELINNLLINPFGNEIDEQYTHLIIEIHRDMIIEDTLNSLVREDLNFRKPLKVKFHDELGVDEGGV